MRHLSWKTSATRVVLVMTSCRTGADRAEATASRRSRRVGTDLQVEGGRPPGHPLQGGVGDHGAEGGGQGGQLGARVGWNLLKPLARVALVLNINTLLTGFLKN